MMEHSIKVITARNNGYKWSSNEKIYFKGYLQDNSGKILKGNLAIEHLSTFDSPQGIADYLKGCFGVYSIIVKQRNEVWAIVDIGRTMPLYYTLDGQIVSDSPNEIVKDLAIKSDCISPIRAFEIYASEYVAFDNTVYSGIKQVLPGCISVIKGGDIKSISYYTHYQKQIDCNRNKAISLLDEKTERMISRMVSYVSGRQIVLSLSGGYDSRYIALSLKKHGVKNVKCYTYGKQDSFEVKQARKITEALGFEWIYIEYSDLDNRNILNDNDFLAYSDVADYTMYLQNYTALKKIKENKLVDDDAVFITGLCNDMPTGFYIPSKETVDSYNRSISGLKAYIIDHRFVRIKPSAEAKKELNVELDRMIDFYNIRTPEYNSFISALDILETIGSHIKCYLNMNQVHDFFGYEWLLPCWDWELLNFWYSLPVDLRINQSLYEEYVTRHLGEVYGITDKKHLNYLAKTKKKEKIVRKMGSFAVSILLHMGIPVRRRTDINNFAPLERDLYKKIHNKKAVKMERASVTLLNNIYILEKKYGYGWFDAIKKYIA